MRTLLYHLSDTDRATLCASTLPRDEAMFKQFEADGLYKIINYSDKRALLKQDVLIAMTDISMPQSVLLETAIISAQIALPGYCEEIMLAYNSLSGENHG